MELYKKYRPQSLDDVVGNAETRETLAEMLSKGRMPHALLLTGSNGCGKTTVARIVAKGLGAHALDIREINSSSFRGIDTIREIEEIMKLAPVGGRCRVWIMDEVHKLSNDAQNAALKMLEDTPRRVFFILCTTDRDKLIKGILNRCSEFEMAKLTRDELRMLCERVALDEESLRAVDSDVLDELVDLADGSPRGALVLLDKLRNTPAKMHMKVLRKTAEEFNVAIDLCRALINGRPWVDVSKILKSMKDDVEKVRWSVLGYARSVLLSTKNNHRAYLIIDIFKSPFYESKDAGLAAACFEVVFSKD